MKTFKEILGRYIKENTSDEEDGISPERFKSDLKTGNTRYSHLHDFAIHKLTGNLSHIGPNHASAIQDWTTAGGYRAAQGELRGNSPSNYGKTLAGHLGEAIHGHPIQHDTWAYRGVHGPHADKLNGLKAGDTFHAKGFVSTTLDPKRATHFAKGQDILAMHIPKGHPGIYASHPKLNPGHPVEQELVLPHNTHMKYLKSESIKVPEHHYSGTPTGRVNNYTLHHVELVKPASDSIQIDRPD